MNRPWDRVWRSLATVASVVRVAGQRHRDARTSWIRSVCSAASTSGRNGSWESRRTTARRNRPAHPVEPTRSTPLGSNPMIPVHCMSNANPEFLFGPSGSGDRVA